MLLNDKSIKELVKKQDMIHPFVDHQVSKGVVSYGLGSFGVDIRLDHEYRIFTNINTTVLDPKQFDEDSFVEHSGKTCVIPPNSFVLGKSLEYFKMPGDVMGICLGKSTYARCGIIVNMTPLEAGWRGYLTIEISNTTPLPARIHSGEGIAQVLFFKGDIPEITYESRAGKYQDQEGIVTPKVS